MRPWPGRGGISMRHRVCSRLQPSSKGILDVRLPAGRSCLTLPFGFRPKARCDATWIYKEYKSYQHVNTWFLAAARPHNSLIDAWLAAYRGTLLRVMDGNLSMAGGNHSEAALVGKHGIPYFLCSCSVVPVVRRVAAARGTLVRLRAPCGGDRPFGRRRDVRVDRSAYMYKMVANVGKLDQAGYLRLVDERA